MGTDLNALRAAVLANQTRTESLPINPAAQVVVDRDGKVIMPVDARTAERTTVVPSEVFA
ncbi:hypothetical protein [Burkholderia plantarii]|uniref:hypothetical protein n=1 Tax=Burkholderia plantarii TaxID=41899 RepID=UPI0018DE294B|nr:hypothetical protein [Burkholderia plantarii]MBI0330247.1 hypothetical protein [Burkholderia plantarii]